jgi:hypothetical protein
MTTQLRLCLVEDDGGAGDLYGASMGEMPYGMHFGSPDKLYATFVKPFTDVVKTAAGKTAELSARAQSAVKVAFEAAATTLVPALSSDYADIFAEEKRRLDAIRQRYSDVYGATKGVLMGNDVLAAAFMFAPWAFLSAGMVARSPGAALTVVNVLGGGNPAVERFVTRVKQAYGGRSASGGDKWSRREDPGMDTWAFEGGIFLGHVINEDAAGEHGRPTLAQVLTSRKVRAALQNSPVVRRLAHDGQAAVKKTLHDVVAKAKVVLRARTFDDVEGVVGKKLPGLDRLRSLQGPEVDAAREEVLRRVRAAMKKVYVANLVKQAETAVKAGLPKDHPYVKAYAEAVRTIDAL